MINIKDVGFIRFYFAISLVFSINFMLTAQGVNVTGLERTWNSDNELGFKSFKTDLKQLNDQKIDRVRLPIDLDYYLNDASYSEKKSFAKLINKILSYADKKKVHLILSNFNHDLSETNYKQQTLKIANNWIEFLMLINENLNAESVYLDIVNEPLVFPNSWEESAPIIIEAIQNKYPNLKLVVGATNANSMYELSRMQPLRYTNIIYSFHFYEPYIFTHQGTAWTGNQYATTGIPFPYKDSIAVMPRLSDKALKTDGEINFRDYPQTGTYQAIKDKLSLVNEWKLKNGVEVWCTEYGVTENADKESRIEYINQVTATLKELNIPGFIWEYEGNFGIKNLNLKIIN